MADSTKLICMIELEIAGGFDWSDCRLVAEQFAEAELESRSGIDGLEGSAFKGVKLHFGSGIRYNLDQLRKLDQERAAKLEKQLPCGLNEDEHGFWYTDGAEHFFDHLEEVIEEVEEELDVLPDEYLDAANAENPHHAEQEEARLSLHEREHDLDSVYS